MQSANVAVDHNQIDHGNLKEGCWTSWSYSVCFMRNHSQVSTVPVNITTGPLQQMMASTCLEPGKTPHENVQFLLVLTCILKAVDKHADLLRESAADVGNDHRLGANEAPPAIISVFLGEQLGGCINSADQHWYSNTQSEGEST